MKALSIAAVMSKAAVSRAYVYKLIKTSDFPKPIKLGVKKSCWLEHEVDAWLAARRLERDAA